MQNASKVKKFIPGKSVTANTDIIDIDITAEYPASCFRVECCFNAAGTLYVKLNNELHALNAGDSLAAGALYAFDIFLVKGETFNLQYSVDANMKRLLIIEMPAEMS